MVLAFLDQRGRVDDDGVERLARVAQRAQHLEGIAAHAGHAGQPVGHGIGLEAIQGRGRAVHAQHLGCPGGRRAQPPGADVAEQVEHPATGAVACQPVAVGALVEEPAGLLAAGRRHREAQAALVDHQRLGQCAVQRLDAALEPLQGTQRAVVEQLDRARVDQIDQHGEQVLLHALHAGGADLHHQHVVVTVDH